LRFAFAGTHWFPRASETRRLKAIDDATQARASERRSCRKPTSVFVSRIGQELLRVVAGELLDALHLW
jgi:hypothetical protein